MILLSGLKRTARKVRGHARNLSVLSLSCIYTDMLLPLVLHILCLQRWCIELNNVPSAVSCGV